MKSIILTAIAIATILLVLRPDLVSEAMTTIAVHLGNLPGFSGKPLHGYCNTCLSDKPYGFPSHQNVYRYWKDRPKSWQIEYSEERVRGNIDNVKSNTESTSVFAGSQPAPSSLNSVKSDYYHDPVSYCAKNPNVYPCPNNWISANITKNFKGSKDFVSDNMYVSGLLQGNYGHVKLVDDKDIDDNHHIRIINPNREDHGLCQ